MFSLTFSTARAWSGRGLQSRQFQRFSSRFNSADFAFAFDIDGVLLRGSKAFDEAKKALQFLENNKVPWILLTNGGGKTEAKRVSDLSSSLGLDISTSQFIQSHTPFRRLADTYTKILVVGGDGDTCRSVAESYGFADCAMSIDVIAADPHTWPFHRYTPDALANLARPLSASKFDAVLVFNDPRDWGCEVQVVTDVLTSRDGVLGTKTDDLVQTMPIYFSNNDLLWANEHKFARFGQGAFRSSLEKVFEDYTARKLRSVIIGKPFIFTYEYAHKVLDEFRASRYGYAGHVKRVYMVGDNPASDIRGGNDYGWHSILVRTGVYKDGDVIPQGSVPKAIVENVYEAVMHAVENEAASRH
ncbi:HAD-like domain-containing protein [Lipomyces arxii]|uniref:HAD-like domain-containing protein n=1 Tax=Lipomyces arxii TaxID=56418 RepID=UPI0034CECF58